MSRQPYRLTPQVCQQIVAGIRSGGYPHVAAEAWGIPKAVFQSWLRRGQEKGARAPYAGLALEVFQAAAQARLRAEIEVFQDDPKIWLERGPGRETADNPGWSVAVKPAETTIEQRHLLLEPQFITLLDVLFQALTPHPELRSEIARQLTDQGIDLAA